LHKVFISVLALVILSSCTPPVLVRDCSELPYFKQGVTAHQASSYARDGSNNDGSHYYIRRNPETEGYVVLEEQSAGTIHRIWMTDANVLEGNIRIYFNYEEAPRIDLPLVEFFGGEVEPFLSPLVGNAEVSSGGYYSYYSFPFETAVRVELTKMPQYYQITYHRYNREQPVYTQLARQSADWDMRVHSFDIEPGESLTLFDIEGARTIEAFELRLLGYEGTRVQMYWDDQTVPSVDVPAEYLLMVGDFPMPFLRRATIVLVNDTQETLGDGTATVLISDALCGGLGSTAGYFTAVHMMEKPTTLGRDYMLMDVEGRGHVVATVLDISQYSDNGILEGDERIYIDGESEPSIHGTGMEDFFNAGWYFNRGMFALPTHGAFLSSRDGLKRVVAYRLSLEDTIPFEKRIKFGIEHGGQNDINAHFESAVFTYMIPTF